ncbi:MAG: response regulator transcription factor [Lewinellaceae bacterium]|nr:response regulator transcription factor [Lewinellaceae bacterium]
MSIIQIAIIEDLKEVAYTLKEIFNEQNDMSCNQIYHNAEDAMLFLPKNPVDIVIVDIGLPRASGLEAMQYISNYCPHTQFCMFTVYDDDEKIFESIKHGAKGYILKNENINKIIISLRELYSGGSPMSPTIARRIIEIFNKTMIQPSQINLPITSREKELLELLSKGLLYKEIADILNITIGTVKQHIHKIYDKLQVSNRTEALNVYKGNQQ